jgi:putative redox protein
MHRPLHDEERTVIIAASQSPHFSTRITNGTDVVVADADAAAGGGGAGFLPHELLEASLASCMNVTLRMYADTHGIPLEGVQTTVTLNRDDPDEAAFDYTLHLEGPLTADQRTRLTRAAAACPVKRTLSRRISFSPHES